jgi:glycosyltransferase involved in cell wall biosynthesis
MQPRFSIVIPIYNRPEELAELLQCIEKQTFTSYEVIVVEDGSTLKCDAVVATYSNKINIKYFYKKNSGQGFARNYGIQRASGSYFIILDSDALLEPDYLAIVAREVDRQNLDLFGGPDKDHPSFTATQKAISYAMTSVFTTGGIRGSKKNVGGQFHPRSFNMGFSRKVYETVGGFKITRMGEDIELSIRIIKAGFKSGIIPEAFIYHKRRTSFSQFYKQLFFFGRARINIGRFFPNELKLVHYFPAIFALGCAILILLPVISMKLFCLAAFLLLFYTILIFGDALLKTKTVKVAVLSVVASYVQLIAYGLGFLKEKILGSAN